MILLNGNYNPILLFVSLAISGLVVGWIIPVLTIVASGFLAWQGRSSGGGSSQPQPQPQPQQTFTQWIPYIVGGIFLIIVVALVFRKR